MNHRRTPHWAAAAAAAIACLLWAGGAASQELPQSSHDPSWEQLPLLADLCPRSIEQCTAERAQRLELACRQYEDWMAAQTVRLLEPAAPQVLPLVAPLLAADERAESAFNQLLALRSKFADSPRDDPRREPVRQYLSMLRAMIDLLGRLNYQQRDALDNATYVLASDVPRLHALIELLTSHRSVPGAKIMGFVLMDPDPESGLRPYPAATRQRVLALMAAARSMELIQDLAEFVRQRSIDPGLRLSAIEVIRHIGVPQDPHPLQDPSIRPPVITAGELLKHARASKLPASAPAEPRQRREALIQWLQRRVDKGVEENHYRIGEFEVHEGDWFLMRNPSPFNMFTDLAPGLFTHVGVVTTLSDDKGVRRFVVTDLPERGDKVPATNVDAYLGAPLHYVFLRHDNEEINRRMGMAAADTIGNETQFDLLFRTDRIRELKGESLKGKRLHTYCAGYLLLCAQQTGAPRTEFFPISEFPPSELCQQNLAKLNVRLGKDYISPTGPLFSPHHQIVGGRKPLYSPDREVLTSAYDHFGRRMATAALEPSPDLFQALRAKVAGLSKYNPWLARALAQANNVSPHMDLQAAAQSAAVIETLDEIANRARDEFRLSRRILTSTDDELDRTLDPPLLEQVPALRKRHAELADKFEQGRLTPRQLRLELVRYYQHQARRDLDVRFFPAQVGSN